MFSRDAEELRVKMCREKVISVIVPVYNTEQYLKECIESIMNQTYKELEIILVDDGSTDKSGLICDEFAQIDKRIKVIHQQNKGVVNTVNVGIESATGEYIAFVDSDDWIDSRMYESMMKEMDGYDIVTTGLICEYYDSSDCQVMITKISEGGYKGKQEMFHIWKQMIGCQSEENLGIPCSRCVHLFRNCIVKQAYLDVNPAITYGEDRIFVFSYLLKSNSIRIMQDAYYHYRMRSGSCTHSVDKNFLTNINNYYVALEKICCEHPLKDVLISQLEEEVVSLIDYAIDHRLGFRYYRNIKYKIPFELEKFKDKKVVLYAAGRVGKDYNYQLGKYALLKEIWWVDQDYDQYSDENLEIKSVESILAREFDYVLIAVKRELLAMNIKRLLVDMKIDEDRILWKEPIQVV